MKVLIDTNIILEILLNQERANEARKLLENSDNFAFFLSDFSLHSIGILLFRTKRHYSFYQFLKDMIFSEILSILSLSCEDMNRVIEVSTRFDLNFDDAYQYVVAEKYGLTIISFDSDFNKTELGRKTPNEVLEELNLLRQK
ncbi:PilT protein domain protein [Thermodesulfobacterium geofontis OPF15]|uniref:PilT protein domain protein n=1 Tax=Thermodesulfobacterium geofontis (strain OPF15) TaxID=795359 RepID=F8C3J4_THEGP|nr:PIN domain-containing protein [Thermodesulfobacterium geofontis]AEH22443.1 PilT protein domain protein [Thermodesulfobacterium geofontis OPF15]